MFLDVVAVAFVPVVETDEPVGGRLPAADAGESSGVSEQLLAGLASGVVSQLGERVPQGVHQAPLHASARSELGSDLEAYGGLPSNTSRAGGAMGSHERFVRLPVLRVHCQPMGVPPSPIATSRHQP